MYVPLYILVNRRLVEKEGGLETREITLVLFMYKVNVFVSGRYLKIGLRLV